MLEHFSPSLENQEHYQAIEILRRLEELKKNLIFL